MFARPVAKTHKAAAGPRSKLAFQRSALVARPLSGGSVEQARILQGTVGNQEVLRYLTRRLSNPPIKDPAERYQRETTPENMTSREASRGFSWDFSKISVFPPDRVDRPQPPSPLAETPLPGAIQAKLAVGPVNDPLEHEADRIADQVMRMPNPRAEATPTPIGVSRACAACETDETLGEKSASWSEASDALAEPGQPLDAATRDFFEPRYQHDFSDVRVHTDARADASARAVNALAYTVGRHIVFRAGQYVPSTRAGLKLAAHELTHVVQQAGGTHALQRQPAPPGPTPAINAGVANFQRMITIMCTDTTLRTAFEMIARDGVQIVLFQTGFDNWQYDDGHTEEQELTGLRGNTDPASRTIRLRNSLSPDAMAETLFHELQHWKHHLDPAGPRGLESEIQARIATEQSAIDRGRPPTGPNYRTADGKVNEAQIRRDMAASPHYSPTGRRRIGRRYVGEAPVPGPFVCPPIGDFPTPSGESRLA